MAGGVTYRKLIAMPPEVERAFLEYADLVCVEVLLKAAAGDFPAPEVRSANLVRVLEEQGAARVRLMNALDAAATQYVDQRMRKAS